MPDQYRLYGLVVESEIPLVEAPPLPVREAADVTVRLGKISMDPSVHPDTAFYEQDDRWCYCMPGERQFLFNTLVGAYEALAGREIIFQPEADGDGNSVRAYLLGTVLGGALQIQQGRFPVHGGSVAVGNRALIVTGAMGAGKSTLTDALIRKGYPFLADDVSALTLTGGVPEVIPSYPQRKLCRDVCLELGYDLELLALISEEREKYAVRNPDEWHGRRLPLGWLVEVIPEDTDRPRIQRVDGHEKLRLLLNSLYRPWIHRIRGIPPAAMKELLAIAAAVAAYRVFRPSGLRAVEPVTELILGSIS